MILHQLYKRTQVLKAKRVTEHTAARLVCLLGWNAVNQTNKTHAAFLQGSGRFLQSFWCSVSVCVWYHMALRKLQGAEWSFCHHRWTGKAPGASKKPQAMQFAYCVCACVGVCDICQRQYSSIFVQVRLNTTSMQLTETVQPSSRNKCHRFLFQLPSESSDQSHFHT